MRPFECWKTAGNDVVHETIENETIVINLAGGIYYSLRGSAVTIWENAVDGREFAEILDAMAATYDAPSEVLERESRRFLAELEAEGLLSRNGERTGTAPPAATRPVSRLTFDLPRFDRFDDMKEMLALDPVHDVDAGGWPLRADS